jgi:hypothetical protein
MWSIQQDGEANCASGSAGQFRFELQPTAPADSRFSSVPLIVPIYRQAD